MGFGTETGFGNVDTGASGVTERSRSATIPTPHSEYTIAPTTSTQSIPRMKGKTSLSTTRTGTSTTRSLKRMANFNQPTTHITLPAAAIWVFCPGSRVCSVMCATRSRCTVVYRAPVSTRASISPTRAILTIIFGRDGGMRALGRLRADPASSGQPGRFPLGCSSRDADTPGHSVHTSDIHNTEFRCAGTEDAFGSLEAPPP